MGNRFWYDGFCQSYWKDGIEYPTNNFNDLIEAQNSGRDWEVHPLISKLNRMHYLTTQQYTCCVGGAVYAYKGKSGSNVLEEEANRWLASNKRNVCYTATIHKFLNKLLNGSPTTYNYAIFDDIDAALYNVMGELNVHTPLDGGMLVNSFLPDLEMHHQEVKLQVLIRNISELSIQKNMELAVLLKLQVSQQQTNVCVTQKPGELCSIICLIENGLKNLEMLMVIFKKLN